MRCMRSKRAESVALPCFLLGFPWNRFRRGPFGGSETPRAWAPPAGASPSCLHEPPPPIGEEKRLSRSLRDSRFSNSIVRPLPSDSRSEPRSDGARRRSQSILRSDASAARAWSGVMASRRSHSRSCASGHVAASASRTRAPSAAASTRSRWRSSSFASARFTTSSTGRTAAVAPAPWLAGSPFSFCVELMLLKWSGASKSTRPEKYEHVTASRISIAARTRT
mmetsp:Transcript_23193/g.69748  ORF Transcript_23193/g.69748 Transcript_23193/m.69748 type:complete len:223 (-) Transcript_23193:1095-1763(-)